MAKTKTLRKLINEKLQTVPGGTYHKRAPKDAEYPYKTFTLTSVAFPNTDRDDLELEVDLWGRALDPKILEDIADQVEGLFNSRIYPEPPIYTAFFRENRYDLDDPDKALQHIQLRFLVQLHETEE
jgi:hypothetical protein